MLCGCRRAGRGSPGECVACGGRGSHQGRCVPVGAGVGAARSSLRRV